MTEAHRNLDQDFGGDGALWSVQNMSADISCGRLRLVLPADSVLTAQERDHVRPMLKERGAACVQIRQYFQVMVTAPDASRLVIVVWISP